MVKHVLPDVPPGDENVMVGSIKSLQTASQSLLQGPLERYPCVFENVIVNQWQRGSPDRRPILQLTFLKRTYCSECGAASVSAQFETVKHHGHHAGGGMTKTDRVPAERGDLRDPLRQMMMKHIA